jgi:hypothetical protein
MGQSDHRTRITLGQLTLDLQKRANAEIQCPEGETPVKSGDTENTLASHIALGMAKHRSSQ